jgi:hypothetical protein
MYDGSVLMNSAGCPCGHGRDRVSSWLQFSFSSFEIREECCRIETRHVGPFLEHIHHSKFDDDDIQTSHDEEKTDDDD